MNLPQSSEAGASVRTGEDEARIPWNDEDMRDYIENGSLNSRH